ncbi:hypothetical protein GCM10023231_28480 [Olivibacter ginsenosidimutans]|uniref:Cytochrome c-552/4 domain-containing protein n=1 Tax=Olivibacter ginsenosidimutans TaxID=1176537 RepID=A0ABP9BRG8_9SPHI
MNRRRLILFLFLLSGIVIIVMQCTERPPTDVRGTAYAAQETCLQCHGEIANQYVHNAHFRTSSVVSSAKMADSLGLNEGMYVFNSHTKVGIEKKADGIHQIAYINGENKKEEHADLAFGAGITAYTLAYWYDQKLMQLPLNYLTQRKEWVNSPGFPSDQIYFGRAIVTKCLECHSSFVEARKIPTKDLSMEETFVKNSLIVGIDCQRCHGPGAEHVTFHQEHPAVKEAKYMASYHQLSQAQKVDMCGVCHSGSNVQLLDPAFFFKPGDTLRNLPEYTTYTGEDPDVHGKQKQLLQASKCYQLSNLDCSSCHRLHDRVEPSLAVYSQTCQKCHEKVKHPSMDQKALLAAKDNCIDCHMPVKSSKAIGFQRSGSKEMIPYQQRTHRIAVY